MRGKRLDGKMLATLAPWPLWAECLCKVPDNLITQVCLMAGGASDLAARPALASWLQHHGRAPGGGQTVWGRRRGGLHYVARARPTVYNLLLSPVGSKACPAINLKTPTSGTTSFSWAS